MAISFGVAPRKNACGRMGNVKEALELFETAAIKQGEAISNGNSKIANHNYDKMATVIKFLRTHKSLHELSKFYTHNNISVRL